MNNQEFPVKTETSESVGVVTNECFIALDVDQPKIKSETLNTISITVVDEDVIGVALQQLIDRAHGNSKAKGFHDDLEELKGFIKFECNDEAVRDKMLTFVDKMNGAMKIALIMSEPAEALEAQRKDLMSDKIPEFTGEEEELADAVIRILDRAGEKKLRLVDAIFAKMAYNEGRPYKHGKQF